MSAPYEVSWTNEQQSTVDVSPGSIPGPQGPPGAPAPLPLTFVLTAVSSWSQSHGYPYLPEVRLIDVDGESVLLGVDYPDASHVALSFPAPFTGTVILS